MHARTARTGESGRSIAWAAAVLAGALGAGAGAWSGCTVTPDNYEVLSFLFDGVPDPNLPAGAVGTRQGEGGRPVFVIVHKPFQEERCEACHRSRYKPSRNDSSACAACHEDVGSSYEFVHGAVAAKACLWCHSPHESSHPALLRDVDRKVCAQCHEVDLLDDAVVPAHADPSRGCLECHSGHGGATKYLLKQGSAGEQPPAVPVPAGPEPDAR